MKMFNRAILLGFLLTLSSTFAFTQGKQSSLEALSKWKTTTLIGTEDKCFQAVAASVEPRTASGITVNLAIGTCMNIIGVPPLTFTVQAVSVTKNVVDEAGTISKLSSPVIERPKDDLNEVIFTPRIVIPDTGAGNAVRITVQGLSGNSDQALTMIVPIGVKTNTSVLGTVQSAPNSK